MLFYLFEKINFSLLSGMELVCVWPGLHLSSLSYACLVNVRT